MRGEVKKREDPQMQKKIFLRHEVKMKRISYILAREKCKDGREPNKGCHDWTNLNFSEFKNALINSKFKCLKKNSFSVKLNWPPPVCRFLFLIILKNHPRK